MPCLLAIYQHKRTGQRSSCPGPAGSGCLLDIAFVFCVIVFRQRAGVLCSGYFSHSSSRWRYSLIAPTKTDPYEYAYTSSTSSSSAVHRCRKNAGMSGATKERALHSWWALWLSRNIPGTYMHNIASLVSAYEKIVCMPSCYTHSGREHYYICIMI